MASYGLNWSTNVSDNRVYTPKYDSCCYSGTTITSVYYNDSTGKIDINYKVNLYSSGSKYNFIAAAAFFNGGEVKRWDPGTPINGDKGSMYWSWSSWNNGSEVGTGTYSVAASTTSITFGAKAMFNGGWGWNRWNQTTYTVTNASGGTLTITQATYAISYNANGGSGGPSSGQTKVYNQSLTLSSTKPTKGNTTANGYVVTFNGNNGTPSKSSATATNTTSYTFYKWNTKADGTGTNYDAGGSYTANAAATLYATYSSSLSRGAITAATASRSNGTATRTLTYNASSNGGTCGTASANSTATITYSCTGWYTAASGGTKRCDSGGSYTPGATETVYAQWSSTTGTYSQLTLPAATKANGTATRTVTFNGNGGTTPSALKSTATITYSQTGWFTAASGGTNRGNAGAKYTPSGNETVHAQFSSTTGAYSAVTLPTPTRTDYIFKGWSTDPNATSGITGSYTPTSDVTLYATWVEDQAKAKMRVGGEWKTGKVFIKVKGEWKKAKKIYHKVDGEWKIGKNS